MPIQITLIRGLPGSGKSTLAKQMVASSVTSIIHLETDMYFVNNVGDYQFNAKQLTQAHQWCKLTVKKHLVKGESVIVSNTFVQRWEMQAYIEMAAELDIDLKVIVCNGQYISTHDVPEKTINAMRDKWQDVFIE